jgi:hypothetical protein
VGLTGDLRRELAAHFLALAEKQEATAPALIGHRLIDMPRSKNHWLRMSLMMWWTVPVPDNEFR